MFKKPSIFLLIACLMSVSGCARLYDYHHAYQQGNVIDEQKVHALKKGMSKQRVAKLMGSPLLQNVFARNRWEYVYMVNDGHHDILSQHVVLKFRRNRLVKIS